MSLVVYMKVDDSLGYTYRLAFNENGQSLRIEFILMLQPSPEEWWKKEFFLYERDEYQIHD